MVDVLKYDAIVCPECGYAALSRFFKFVTNPQSKMIHEQISASFKGLASKILESRLRILTKRRLPSNLPGA